MSNEHIIIQRDYNNYTSICHASGIASRVTEIKPDVGRCLATKYPQETSQSLEIIQWIT